jgi:hypothetical protein
MDTNMTFLITRKAFLLYARHLNKTVFANLTEQGVSLHAD